MKTPHTFGAGNLKHNQAAFTLIEVLVAIALGLLLSIGILSLFAGTSRTNKLQDGLARLQENGRFAVSRIEGDLRMLGGQVCSNSTGNATSGPGGTPYWSARAPMVYMNSVTFPDSTGPIGGGAPFALDPRFFVQGYECTSGGCSSLPALGGTYSSQSVADGQRVPNSDVLTLRFQQGTGWPIATNTCKGTGGIPVAAGDSIKVGDNFELAPQAGDDPLPATVPSTILISYCKGSAVFPAAGFTSAAPPTVTIGNLLGDAPASLCQGDATDDARVFDFSNFGTVSFFLVYRKNNDPDANGRLIPTLVRRVNGGDVVDLVQGVDQLDFLYGVLDVAGLTRFMTATQIDAAPVALCAPAPGSVANSAGCLWRSVRSVESHMLVSSTRELGLDDVSRSFVYMGATTNVANDGSTPLRSGQAAGSLLRREFVSQTMIRNRNP